MGLGRLSGPSRHAYGPIGNPGCPIGNPVGLIARWRAAQVRPAPRQSAPGAMVGQVCALGAISSRLSALWRHPPLFPVRFSAILAICIDTACRYFCALSAGMSFVYKVFLTSFSANQGFAAACLRAAPLCPALWSYCHRAFLALFDTTSPRS